MIEYRKAAVDEADLLAKIRIDFLFGENQINSEDINEAEQDIIYKNNKQYINNSLSDGSFVSWVAVANGRIIATSGITFYTLPPSKKCSNGKMAYISNMFTYPNYRRQGIASKLFTLILEEAKTQGCVKVVLHASDTGKTIYKKFGFKDTTNDMVYYF